jgi:hypothetical protein
VWNVDGELHNAQLVPIIVVVVVVLYTRQLVSDDSTDSTTDRIGRSSIIQ